MSKRVPCSLCATPIEMDDNGVWIDPDAPDHLGLIECPMGVVVEGRTLRSYHDYYGEEA